MFNQYEALCNITLKFSDAIKCHKDDVNIFTSTRSLIDRKKIKQNKI